MYGAILGDIIGSEYEFANCRSKTKNFPLFSASSEFTDDTVMTLAVAKALTETIGMRDEKILESLVRNMQQLGRIYPNAGYGGRFSEWLREEEPLPYNSCGNGSAMRVSAAGWLYNSLDETLHAAELTAMVSHNHPEGIKGAQATAGAVFLARTGYSKQEIRSFLTDRIGYSLDFTVDGIRPFYRFDVTCQGSVPQSMEAFLEASNYEETVRLAVSLGGDTDTMACIAGAVAEAYYGMPQYLILETEERLTDDLRAILLKSRDIIQKRIREC